jgi:hypothetical protein
MLQQVFIREHDLLHPVPQRFLPRLQAEVFAEILVGHPVDACNLGSTNVYGYPVRFLMITGC